MKAERIKYIMCLQYLNIEVLIKKGCSPASGPDGQPHSERDHISKMICHVSPLNVYNQNNTGFSQLSTTHPVDP